MGNHVLFFIVVTIQETERKGHVISYLWGFEFSKEKVNLSYLLSLKL